jgi:hypothetical protein
VNKVIVVILGLFFAVHVSVGNIPAPVPVFLVAGGVIFSLCFLIWEALHATAPSRARGVWST